MIEDMTFVGPEGVYTNIEEIKPSPYIVTASPKVKLTSIVVHCTSKQSNIALPGWQLLGGNRDKENKKEKDEASLSSSDKLNGTEEDSQEAVSPTLLPQSPSFDPTKNPLQSSNTAHKKKRESQTLFLLLLFY